MWYRFTKQRINSDISNGKWDSHYEFPFIDRPSTVKYSHIIKSSNESEYYTIDELNSSSIIDSSSASDFDSGVSSKINESTATSIHQIMYDRCSNDSNDTKLNYRNSCNNSCKCQVEIITERLHSKSKYSALDLGGEKIETRTIKVNDCDCQQADKAMNNGNGTHHFVSNIGYEKSNTDCDGETDSMVNGYAKVTVRMEDISCCVLLSFAHQIANGMVSYFCYWYIVS